MATATRRSSRLSSLAERTSSAGSRQTANPRKRKQSPGATPSTPPQKRQRPAIPPAPTPTPSAVGLMAHATLTAERPANPMVARLADPQTTNATLLSPETSRVITHTNVTAIPSKLPQPSTTTATLLEEANTHLIKVDERMRPLVENNFCRVFSPEGLAEVIDPFESLASGIISQQVSGAAAKSIKAKFVALFEGDRRFPHPSDVAPLPIERLRTAGLSQRKAEYIKGLAEKFVSGELSAQMLNDAPYEEVLGQLIAVRGLGKWSVEMFACFGLKRMDVFSLGDLGVQRGMAAFVGKDVAKLKNKGGKWKYMSEKEMLELSEKFAPYRSLFMWYMWRVEETDISTME
ncbi:DNA-3-methyladenine glycosylase-like protein [Emericellopsis cladophorae]|uniref:DNA-3-methyladenine glycosylase-like protein n=1 Tax=Emericellopsis cladophorae TaxID=2686198 RepID=A0A9P9Y6F5_9HYPO|nr:DNA-3-methyladenine glycosylase-like protein [Emericellopsis cladophorae]KAI6784361.1 DNA-3-methyladenine glycosylase-like protein [Emericellopsis cladophorae]